MRLPFSPTAQKYTALAVGGAGLYYIFKVGVDSKRMLNVKGGSLHDSNVGSRDQTVHHVPSPYSRPKSETLHSETETTPVPLPNQEQPGSMNTKQTSSPK